MVTVHIITISYNYMYRHMYSYIWRAWSSDPREGRIGVSRNSLELDHLTIQFSGQTQTVDIRGLNISVCLMKIFKYIIIIIRQPLCPVVGRRPQHVVSK